MATITKLTQIAYSEGLTNKAVREAVNSNSTKADTNFANLNTENKAIANDLGPLTPVKFNLESPNDTLSDVQSFINGNGTTKYGVETGQYVPIWGTGGTYGYYMGNLMFEKYVVAGATATGPFGAVARVICASGKVLKATYAVTTNGTNMVTGMTLDGVEEIDAGGAQDGAYIRTHDNLFYVGMWCPNERYGQAAWTTALPADGSIYPILRFDLYGFTFDDDTPVHVAIVCYLYGSEIYNAGYMSLEGDVVEDVRLYVDENDRLCIYVRMDKDYYYLSWQVMAGSRNADIGESYFTDWSLATGAAAAQSIIPSLAKTEVVCTRKQIAAEATATTALNTANEANSKATNAQTAAQTAVSQSATAKSAADTANRKAADALAAVDGFVKNVLTFGEVTPGTYSPGARELSFTSVKAQAGDSVTFCAIINNGGQTRSGGTFLLRRGSQRYINWTEGAGIEASTGYNAVTADVTQATFATRAGIVEGRVFISALTAQIVVCDADSSNGYIIK